MLDKKRKGIYYKYFICNNIGHLTKGYKYMTHHSNLKKGTNVKTIINEVDYLVGNVLKMKIFLVFLKSTL